MENKATRRCPRCGEDSLEIDFRKGEAHCRKCGFQQFLQKQ